MKKTLLIAMTVLGTFIAKAQYSNLGITAGYSNITAKAESNGNSSSNNQSGYFIGLTNNYYINDVLDIQTSFIYATYKFEGAEENFDLLQVPILAKYFVSEQFSLLGGPQVNYIIDDEIPDELTSFSIGLNLGVGYDITESISTNLNYQFQLSNTFTGDDDYSLKYNYLNLGLTYYFQ